MTEPRLPVLCQRLGRCIEVYNPALVRGRVRHALFDFDGTLSLLRAGWQEVMVAQFAGELARIPTGESHRELVGVCREFITRLTGEQTIYQMLQLEEEIRRRGGQPQPALEYKREYLRLLDARIGHRIEAVRKGRAPAGDFLVRGSLALLDGLRQRGATCYLASGTDRQFVEEEVGLLGLAPFFGAQVYGAVEEYKTFSKKLVIERIIAEHQLQGPELAVFGDGYVEIENARSAGSIAVAAATRESGEEGWDPWKKDRLLGVGADLMVPDWREADLLLAYLFGEGE